MENDTIIILQEMLPYVKLISLMIFIQTALVLFTTIAVISIDIKTK